MSILSRAWGKGTRYLHHTIPYSTLCLTGLQLYYWCDLPGIGLRRVGYWILLGKYRIIIEHQGRAQGYTTRIVRSSSRPSQTESFRTYPSGHTPTHARSHAEGCDDPHRLRLPLGGSLCSHAVPIPLLLGDTCSWAYVVHTVHNIGSWPGLACHAFRIYSSTSG